MVRRLAFGDDRTDRLAKFCWSACVAAAIVGFVALHVTSL